MKILFVLENYYPNIGGVEKLFKTLLEELAENGHQITLVTTRLTKESPRKEVLGNLTIHRYSFINRYFFTFFAFFHILFHVRKCDLVHTTSYNAGLPAYFAAKLARKKIVITFHEVWGDLWFRLPYMSSFARKLHYAFEQFLLKLRFDYFIAVSQSTADTLHKNGIPKERIILNYNGMDYTTYERFKEIPQKTKDETFVYTYCGRLGISKGMDLILEAATTFRKTHPNSQLQMIIPTTPAPLFKTILAEIERLGLTDYIRLRHHLSYEELVKAFKASDCMLIPSYSEGFCFVAAECAALSVPFISSDRTALKEVQSSKFIRMPEHTANGLVQALEKAYADDWEITPLKRYELRDTVERYIGLYKDILVLGA